SRPAQGHQEHPEDRRGGRGRQAAAQGDAAKNACRRGGCGEQEVRGRPSDSKAQGRRLLSRLPVPGRRCRGLVNSRWQVRQPTKGPSIFLGALAGYAIASALGALLTVVLSARAGRASAAAGLEILASLGALGAYLGYCVAVRRRRARGVSGPLRAWPKFLGSGTFALLALVVLAGSFGLAVLIKVVFDALA